MKPIRGEVLDEAMTSISRAIQYMSGLLGETTAADEDAETVGSMTSDEDQDIDILTWCYTVRVALS